MANRWSECILHELESLLKTTYCFHAGGSGSSSTLRALRTCLPELYEDKLHSAKYFFRSNGLRSTRVGEVQSEKVSALHGADFEFFVSTARRGRAMATTRRSADPDLLVSVV